MFDSFSDPTTRHFQARVRIALASGLAVVALIAISFSMAATAQAQIQSPTCPNPYIVQSRDNLMKLATADGVTIDTLQALNGIINPNLIFVGQTLCLPNPLPTAISVPSVTPSAAPTLSATVTGTDTGLLTQVATTTTPSTTPTLMPTVMALPTVVVPSTTPIVYPSIALSPGYTNLASAQPITVTGINFPASATVQIYYKPIASLDAYAPIGQTVASVSGTINAAVTVPPTFEGAPMFGAVSILVRDPVSGYYGYSFFYSMMAAN